MVLGGGAVSFERGTPALIGIVGVQELRAGSGHACPEPGDHQLAKTLKKRGDELLAQIEALRGIHYYLS